MKKNKVEIYKDFVIKNNIANSKNVFQRFAETFSIQFKRELRVYNMYSVFESNYLLIPDLLEVGYNYFKMERLYQSSYNIDPYSIVPNLREFMLLAGDKARFSLFDFLSSPALGVIRGSLFGVLNYGVRQHVKILICILKLSLNRKFHKKIYLIHKDLHINKNIMNTEKGVYFYDFGQAIFTKRYFLTDVIQLSINFPELEFNPIPIIKLLQSLGYDKGYINFASMQIKIILYKRSLHFHIDHKRNIEFMKKVKMFVSEIDNFTNSIKELHFRN